MRLRFFALLCSALLAACSTGWNHSYHTLAPKLQARGFGKILVVTRDQRPYVMSGERRAQYVGMVEGMYGEPWEALTASGKPLAQDLSTAACNALIGRGYECLPLISGQSEIKDEIDYLITAHYPVRILYFIIDDWQSRTYTTTLLNYDLLLDVWNRRSKVMAAVRVKGQDELATTTMFNPAQNASVVVPRAFEQYLELLLNNEKVVEATSMAKEIDVLGAHYKE